MCVSIMLRLVSMDLSRTKSFCKNECAPSVQSMEETEEFVRLAMKTTQMGPILRFDNDDFIDDAIAADAQHQFRPVGRFNAENW